MINPFGLEIQNRHQPIKSIGWSPKYTRLNVIAPLTLGAITFSWGDNVILIFVNNYYIYIYIIIFIINKPKMYDS